MLTRRIAIGIFVALLLVMAFLIGRESASAASVTLLRANAHETAGVVPLGAPVVVVDEAPPPPATDEPGPCLVRPVTGDVGQGFRPGGHSGVDFAQWFDPTAPIHACRSGTVTSAGWDGGYGLATTIDQGGGQETMYAHQSELLVSVGQHVEAGDVIGRVGSTGSSSGAHLHFEVHSDGRAVDPMPYLPGP